MGRAETVVGLLEAVTGGGTAEKQGSTWVPYTGPQGGSGWRNAETGEVSYGDEPPGPELGDPGTLDQFDDDELEDLAGYLFDQHQAAQEARAGQGGRREDTEMDRLMKDTLDRIRAVEEELQRRGGEKLLRGKAWVPYTGPQGGQGWQNPDSGEVIYGDEPPGEVPHPNELMDMMEAGELDAPDPESLVDMLERAADEHGLDIESPGDLRDLRDTGGTAGAEREGEAPWDGERHDDPVPLSTGAVTDAVEENYQGSIDIDGLSDQLDQTDDQEQFIKDTFGSRDAVQILKDAKRGPRYEDNSAPDRLDPTNAEEITDIMDVAEAESGVTASAMDVATMPDGEQVYVTAVGKGVPEGTGYDHEVSPEDAENAVAAEAALDAMGFDVPDHHYEHNRFYAVEDADGPTVSGADWDDLPPLDSNQARQVMAAQLLVGNRDSHGGNIAAVERTEDAGAAMGDVTQTNMVPFDLDLSFDDATDWADHSSGKMPAGLRKAARTMAKAEGQSVADWPQIGSELQDQASQLAYEIDIEEVKEQIPDEEKSEAFERNVKAFRGTLEDDQQ